MRNIWYSFIRVSSFFGKEVNEVIRQPRLILSLILGPFLILFIFGIGYSNTPRTVRALFVVSPGTPLSQQIQANAGNISPQFIYVGQTGDKNAALAQLYNKQVDLVVVAPDNAYETIRNNQQAVFTQYHNEIDPSQASYMQYLGQVYVDEVNRRVLIAMTQESQSKASNIRGEIDTARANIKTMRDALTSGDVQKAQGAQQALNTSVSQLALSTGAAAALLSEVQSNGSSTQASNQNLLGLLNDLQKNSTSADPIPQDQAGVSSEIAKLDKADSDLTQMEQQLTDFQSISPDVLVRPFTVDTRSITSITVTTIDFFTPAVIVLLLQHIAVTIAALSIVRERRSGAMELFRVSPVSSLETLLGKYISYLVFGLIIGAILTALIYFGLHVPMLGNWWLFALVGLALLFASIGLGFVISLIAETESQAVQLAMISLLLSVFFSGFMLDLRYFYVPVRVLSYLIPATYGINLLQNIMLRGVSLNPIYFGGLLLYGLVFFIFAWLLLKRQMRTR